MSTEDEKKKFEVLTAPLYDYHKGYVDHALPTFIIAKIIGMVWDELLNESHAIDLSLPMIYKKKDRLKLALELALINKLLFNHVATLPSSFQMIESSSEMMKHLHSIWCPFKTPVRIHSSDRAFCLSLPSFHLMYAFHKMKYLYLFPYRITELIRMDSFKNIGSLMTNLVSFTATQVFLDTEHYKVLLRIPTLVKFDISQVKSQMSQVNIFLSELDRPVQSLILPTRCEVTSLKNIVVESVKTYSGPLSGQCTFTSLNKYIHNPYAPATSLDVMVQCLSNIRHLVFNFRYTLDGFSVYDFIQQLPFLQSVEDCQDYCDLYSVSDSELPIYNITNIKPTFTIFIIRFYLQDREMESWKCKRDAKLLFTNTPFKYQKEQWKFRKWFRKVYYHHQPLQENK